MEIILFILLFRKDKKLSIMYLIAMIMVAFWIVPYCLEHTWTFLIMLITSIIAICIENKNNAKLNILFLISGMLTCFFDFLTTEIITLFVPMLLVLIIRKQEGRLMCFKEAFKFVIKVGVLWSMGYFGMWFSKWIIASIYLNINAMDYVIDNAKVRINGLQRISSAKEMYTGAIFKNWYTLYPINIIKKKSMLPLIPIIFSVLLVLLLDWKNIKKMWFSAILLLISLTPYLRYIILANHSYTHHIFTFRMQIINILALGWAVLESLNYNLIFKEIELKKKRVI